jgi:hypothetical protein
LHTDNGGDTTFSVESNTLQASGYFQALAMSHIALRPFHSEVSASPVAFQSIAMVEAAMIVHTY